MKYEVSYWTIIEADSEAEAIEYFIANVDEQSVDVKEVDANPTPRKE